MEPASRMMKPYAMGPWLALIRLVPACVDVCRPG